MPSAMEVNTENRQDLLTIDTTTQSALRTYKIRNAGNYLANAFVHQPVSSSLFAVLLAPFYSAVHNWR